MAENIRNSAKVVGTTAVIASPELEFGQRNLIVITNTSTGGQVISISVGQEAVGLAGITLYAGGSWFESVGNGFVPTNEKIWVISSAAAGAISIHERVERRV